jgi:adenylate cyclase
VTRLKLEELAGQSGSTVEDLARLTELGIIPAGSHGAFSPEDVSRVRLAFALGREGIGLERLAKAIAEGTFSLQWFHGMLPPPIPLLPETFGEVVDSVGLGFELADRLYSLFGLATPPVDSPVREDDAQLLETGGETLAILGGDSEKLVAAARYFGDNLRRIAASQVAFFSQEVLEPLLASGQPMEFVIRTADQVADNVVPAGKRLVSWLHARQFEAHIVQSFVQLAEGALHAAGLEPAQTGVVPAIAFLDLQGYTRLTEDAGDEAATRLAIDLEELVARTAQPMGGRPVKFLGDGVMFHFPDAAHTVACGLALVERATQLGLPAARVGAHAGPVVFRDGDYFGGTVNVAARICDYARPKEVLVSDTVRTASGGRDLPFLFEDIGPIQLKGVREPVRLSVAYTNAENGG